MKKNPISGRSTALAAILLAMLAASPALLAQDMSDAIAEAAGIPNVPAFLPDKYSVAPTEALPIDGVWLISANKKKIRIEQGRAYAMDPWLHLLVLKVQPDMVVMQNFRRTGPGTYQADDLPLLGPATLSLNGEGHLDVSVQGKLGPVRYGLSRLEAQYPEALAQEVMTATGRTLSLAPVSSAPLPGMPQQPPAYQQPPPQQAEPVYRQPPPAQPSPPRAPDPAATECTPIGVDPDTGQTICAY